MSVPINTSTEADEIPQTYEEAVQMLAEWHAGIERPDLEIYAFPDPEEQVVRLVEVSGEFPESGEIVPVMWGQSDEFPFRSSVAILTPREWRRVFSGELRLPEGWELATRRKVWPHDGDPGVPATGAE